MAYYDRVMDRNKQLSQLHRELNDSVRYSIVLREEIDALRKEIRKLQAT